MKKNMMMRLASVLLIVVLLTTSVVGGTFAKYVTVDSGTDTATVAKWGVTVTVADDLGAFKTQYEKHDTGTDYTGLTVKSAANPGVDLVAPGTSGSMTFNISGTPEVATRVKLDATATNVVKLVAGDYELAAGKFANAKTTVTTTADYEPIRFFVQEGTMTDAELAAASYTITLDGLDAAIGALTKTFAPNVPIDTTYTLAWKWAFENTAPAGDFTSGSYTGAKLVDFLDTYLGDQGTLQTEELSVTVTVEQID